MGVNKVEYGDETLIDLTGDTVTEDTLSEGVTAHNAQGEMITGQMTQSSGGTIDLSNKADLVNGLVPSMQLFGVYYIESNVAIASSSLSESSFVDISSMAGNVVTALATGDFTAGSEECLSLQVGDIVNVKVNEKDYLCEVKLLEPNNVYYIGNDSLLSDAPSWNGHYPFVIITNGNLLTTQKGNTIIVPAYEENPNNNMMDISIHSIQPIRKISKMFLDIDGIAQAVIEKLQTPSTASAVSLEKEIPSISEVFKNMKTE